MTLGAVVHEQALANGHGLRILGHVLWRHGREPGVQGCDRRVALVHFGLMLTGRSPAQLAGVGTQPWIQGQIDKRKNEW